MSRERETLWAGLFAFLKDKLKDDFTVIGRRHIAPPDLTPEQQPALFCCALEENLDKEPQGTGGTDILGGVLFLYDYQADLGEAPGTETSLAETKINNLLDKIEDALAPPITKNRQTLGGLVYNCWIGGKIPIDPGILGSQAGAAIPIFIEVP